VSLSGEQCASCPVREHAVCAALDDAERAELGRIGVTRTLKRGEPLIGAGTDNFACATLISGALKISAIDRDGVERIVAMVHPAGFVGELFVPEAHHHVSALTGSTLCLFPRGDYERAIERHPRLAHALLQRSAQDLAETRQLVDLIGRRTSRERVAGLLLLLARSASRTPCAPATEFDLPLTRGEMAGLLGLTIETVSRRLTELMKDGLIKKTGTRGIRILDVPSLEGLVK
jgi:CRP/FNR family transcriptional regulator